MIAVISILIKPEEDQYKPSVKCDNLTHAGNTPTKCRAEIMHFLHNQAETNI